MVGYKQSQLDYDLYVIIKECGDKINNYVHLRRWLNHIESFAEYECKTDDSNHIEHVNLIKIILDWKVKITFLIFFFFF